MAKLLSSCHLMKAMMIIQKKMMILLMQMTITWTLNDVATSHNSRQSATPSMLHLAKSYNSQRSQPSNNHFIFDEASLRKFLANYFFSLFIRVKISFASTLFISMTTFLQSNLLSFQATLRSMARVCIPYAITPALLVPSMICKYFISLTSLIR